MYLSYYKLSKKPFQISTDPSFFWLGKKHKEALSILNYAVIDDKGFLLLTGDVGTGKTTLINTFVNSLGDEVIVSRVSDPGLTQLDFINYIAKIFKIETELGTKSEFLILFTEFLEQAHRDDKKVLLIIDEAQHLTDETLEEIRLLSNIENHDKKLLNIFLVGQSEFNDNLEKYKNRALRQRLTLNYTLYPLEAEETKSCVEYRLKVAGAENEIFQPDAIDVIHTVSNGFPRIINIICDHALRLGCQEDQKTISTAIIDQCTKSLRAVHLPLSQQHDTHFGSTNEWLEESEVPPLSPEAINRVSQPLPDFLADDEPEAIVKVRPYSAIVLLILTGLFIYGLFFLKDDSLDSVTKFLSNLKKDTISFIARAKGSVNNSPELVQNAEDLLSSETIPASANASEPPAGTVKEPDKQTFKINISEGMLETEVPETDSHNTSQEQQIVPSLEVDRVVEQPGTDAPLSPISSSDNLDDANAEIRQEEANVKPEISIEPLQPPGNQTPTIVEKGIENKKQPSSQAVVGSVPQVVESTVVQSRVKPELKTPTSSSFEETSDINEDPGAVIDWLLKAKQNLPR